MHSHTNGKCMESTKYMLNSYSFLFNQGLSGFPQLQFKFIELKGRMDARTFSQMFKILLRLSNKKLSSFHFFLRS